MSLAGLANRAVRKGHNLHSQWASRYIVSLGKADPDMVFIAGTGRSGTTWLAEVLQRASRRRLVFEPFRNDRVPQWEGASVRQYVRADDVDSEFLEPARAILSPRFRNEWADYYNDRIFTRGRIVKEISANLMLRWLYKQLGPFPIIFVIRNPAAVAASWLGEGWFPSPAEWLLGQEGLVRDYLGTTQAELGAVDDPLQRVLYLWAVETMVPLTQFDPAEMLIVFYEDLVIDPESELLRIQSYLGWRRLALESRILSRPSATSNPAVSYASQAERVRSWTEGLTSQQLSKVEEITARFGLHKLYRADGMPAVHGDSVLQEWGTRFDVEASDNAQPFLTRRAAT